MNKQSQMNNKQIKMTKEECFAKLEESLRKSIDSAEYALSHLIRFYYEGTDANFYNQFIEEKDKLFTINNNLIVSWNIATELLLAEKAKENGLSKVKGYPKSMCDFYYVEKPENKSKECTD